MLLRFDEKTGGETSNVMSSSNSAGGGGSAAAAAAAAAGKNKGGAAGAKGSKALSTSAKRIQKELAEITVDPPPNCRY